MCRAPAISQAQPRSADDHAFHQSHSAHANASLCVCVPIMSMCERMLMLIGMVPDQGIGNHEN